MLNRLLGSVLSVMVTVAACGPPFGSVDCTTEALPGIAITIRHGATGDSIGRALVIAEDGAFVDSTRSDGSGTAALAFERPGTYAVTVTKKGFSSWSRSPVRVSEGECHVELVHLTAVLDSV